MTETYQEQNLTMAQPVGSAFYGFFLEVQVAEELPSSRNYDL